MYQAGLRKKTIKVRNAPTMTDNKIEKHEDRTLELYMEVQKVLDSKEHLVLSMSQLSSLVDFQLKLGRIVMTILL